MNIMGVGAKSSAKLTPHFEYGYIITPGNFLNLSEENKQKKLGQFFDVLRVIEKPVRITMSKKMMLITIEGKEKPMPVMQVHIESNEPLSDILNQIKFDFAAEQRPPHLIVKKEYLKSMMLAETYHKVKANPEMFYQLSTFRNYYQKDYAADLFSSIAIYKRKNISKSLQLLRERNLVYVVLGDFIKMTTPMFDFLVRYDEDLDSLYSWSNDLYEKCISHIIENKKFNAHVSNLFPKGSN